MVNPCPNDFVEKVNRGEDLRWVGSRCPLMRALVRPGKNNLGRFHELCSITSSVFT